LKYLRGLSAVQYWSEHDLASQPTRTPLQGWRMAAPSRTQPSFRVQSGEQNQDRRRYLKTTSGWWIRRSVCRPRLTLTGRGRAGSPVAGPFSRCCRGVAHIFPLPSMITNPESGTRTLGSSTIFSRTIGNLSSPSKIIEDSGHLIFVAYLRTAIATSLSSCIASFSAKSEQPHERSCAGAYPNTNSEET
jgi:hypothetical protein